MGKRTRQFDYGSRKRTKKAPVAMSRAFGRNFSQGIPNPPSWSSTISVGYTQRFVCNTAGGVASRAVGIKDLLDLKCVAATATSAYRIFTGVKINRISMWCANTAATAANTIQLEWTNSASIIGSSSRMVTDTAVGTTNVAYITTKPPRGGNSADWIGNVAANTTLFEITCPQGTIIDVAISVTFADDETATAVSGAVAAATVGILYTRALDSSNVAPALFPIGVITI